MTDAELDRDWVPNGRRPQSTMARSFSQELMDVFRIDDSLTDLDHKVDKRRQDVDQNTKELADLEARIREMEDRLRRSQGGKAAPRSQQAPTVPPPPPPKDESQSKSRPGTARATRQAPSSGNMPPTPGGSEDGDAAER